MSTRLINKDFGSKFTIFAFFTLYLRAIFQVQAPGEIYLEGRFNGGFFAIQDWGGNIKFWRGLFSEFYGIRLNAGAPNFCPQATRKSQIFHTNHMLGTLDFTVSEHWAPFNFP